MHVLGILSTPPSPRVGRRDAGAAVGPVPTTFCRMVIETEPSGVPPGKPGAGPGAAAHHGLAGGQTSASQTAAKRGPLVSSRRTPTRRAIRFRPDWDQALGIALLLVGAAVAALNDLILLDFPPTLLPGGHNELYLILGVVIAGYSTWWFGWFDREH